MPPETFPIILHDARYFDDLRFYATIKVYSHWVDFEIHNLIGTWPDGRPVFEKKGSTCGEAAESLEDAELFLHGDVKWDGCSNWYFDEQDNVMLHGCSREDLTRIGEVMARCWDYTKETLETWGV